jgi:sugar phosphate isomerase/epimerase
MNLGISSYTYGWNIGVPGMLPAKTFTELDLISKAVDFGVSIVQVGDNLPLHEFDKNRLANFKAGLKKYNLQLEIGARGLTDDHLSDYIDLACQMGSHILRFVIDSNNYQPSHEEIIRVIKNHEYLLQRNKIILAIENHDRFKVTTYAKILEQVHSNHVGICLDTANSLGAGESVETILEVLGPDTVNLHIKDFGIERLSHKMGFVIQGRIAGEGALNIPALLKKIKSFGKCHSAILEQWVPPVANIDDTINKEERWAEKSIEYLKDIETWDNSLPISIHQNKN